ncbi:MAG: MopE-related protein [Myxococcota bacterium]|nr:MopE-related protein [Myxococcota bacterium]
MRFHATSLAILLTGCEAAKPVGIDEGSNVAAEQDRDGDGYSDQEDCDDDDASVHPGALEICDGVDNDCDDQIDEDVLDTWYADTDADGYGDPERSVEACDGPPGHVPTGTDCDDAEPSTYPSAPEVCDGTDNDCDGQLDDGLLQTWYIDADGDGFGETTATVEACEAPANAVLIDGDCDDSNPAYNPDAALGCDGEDYNCDGLVDNDGDRDGYAAGTCGGNDCDDTDASIRPDGTGDCALGLTCDDILDMGRSVGDGHYFIDPDGYATGLDPFEVYCDMTTDGGGWTEIAYVADVPFQQWHTSGDAWAYFPDDFELVLSDGEIAAVQALSTEGWQDYVGRCDHVIHYLYADTGGHQAAFGFKFLDGTETPRGQASYAPFDITVTRDGCATNGGEGGSLALTTDFHFESVLVPVINAQCEDCGEAFPERLGVELVDNPAWLR